MSDLTLKLREGIWQVIGTVKIPGRKAGVRVRESTGTSRLRDAEAYRDKKRQEVIDQEIYGPGYSLTFADCVLLYLEKGGEKRFIRPILEKFGETRIQDLTADKVSAFRLEHYGHLAPASVKRTYYTPLNAAVRKGCIAHNIAPRSFEAPSSQSRAITEAPPGWFPDFFQAAHFRIAVVVLFLTTTGARVSEACRVALNDCQFDHPRGPKAILRRTKNGKPRMVPLTDGLARAMQGLIELDKLSDLEAAVFGYASRWSVNQAIERVCATAGIKYYSSHKLGRHAFAARLLAEGHTLKHVQGAGGWSSIQIVSETYGHLEANATDAAVLDTGSQLDPFFPGTPLTHERYQRQRKVKKTPCSLVGTRGIEPLTPSMSREGEMANFALECPQTKEKMNADHARTDVEPAVNLQETKSKV